MAKRALITGSEGFVGRALRRCLEADAWEVLRCDFRAEDGVAVCDVSNYEQVEKLLGNTKALTHIFHLAAQTFVPESLANPAPTLQSNLLGTVNVVQAMQKLCPEARLIFIGSSDAYGPPQYLPVDELHPLFPQNPYAISKAAADHYCAYAAQAHNLDIIRMRPFNHSGAGQSPQFVLSNFAQQVAAIEAGKQESVMRVGDLSAARDFSHVDDVVDAYLLSAQYGLRGEAYNVCSGVGRSVQSALDTLISLAKVEIRVEQDPARMRPVDIAEMVGSCEKLSAHCGWHAKRSFDKMLGELLDYWRERLAV